MARTRVSKNSATAEHGEKMIEVKLRFWTNDISPERGKILKKHAWSSGVVRMDRNAAHGITPKQPRPFQSLLNVGAVIEKVLIDHGVILHPSRQMKRYFSE